MARGGLRRGARAAMKRALGWAILVAVMGGVGGVGGALYPYTASLFGRDVTERERERHHEIMLNDTEADAKRRALYGAAGGAGLALMTLVTRRFSRADSD